MLLYIIFSLLLTYSYVSASLAIPMNSSALKYAGRWQPTPQGMQTGWPGAYLQTIVHSTQLRLLIAQPTTLLTQIDNTSWIQHKVYQQQQQQQQHSGNQQHYFDSTVIELDLVNNQVDWSLGPHTVTIVSTEDAPLHLIGLMLADDGSVTLPARNPASHVVEFIGHDPTLDTAAATANKLGSFNYSDDNNSSNIQPLITHSFPFLVSDILGIDHAHIAYSGARLLDGDHQSRLGMQTRYFDWSIFTSSSSGLSAEQSPGLSTSSSSSSNNSYDFTSYDPTVIVLLLGHYDDDIPQYRIALVQFLQKIRQRHQTTPILVMSEPFGEMVRSTQAAVYQCNDQGDLQIFYIDTTGWLHYDGSIENGNQMTLAHKLAPMIQVKLATPPLPLPDAPPNPALPDDWETMDVGNQGLHGSVSFDAGSSFTLWGSGTNMNGRTDAFRFVYQTLSGQGAIEATVESHAAFARCATAGIIMREHLALGSAYVATGISPEDGLFVRTRDYNFNNTRLLKKLLASPPYRVRLERTSDHDFIARAKKVGDSSSTWETLAVIPKLSLAQEIYMGLFVSSCDETVVSVAKFTDVTLQGGMGRMNLHPSVSSPP